MTGMTPVSPDATISDPLKPIIKIWNPAGSCDPSSVSGGPLDWYIHTQGYYGFYERREKWRDCDTSKLAGPTAPSVEFNYIDARTTVWTSDKIMYNTTFSACLTALQNVNIQASGSCSSPGGNTAASGWGDMGAYSTSGEGTILRPARKDAGGNILDPQGYCQEAFNFELGMAPGAYSCSSGWDTRNNARTDLGRLTNECNNYCPTFNGSLVNI